MIKFHNKHLWRRIGSVSIRAKAKRGAIAYVTTDLPLRFQQNDVLVADCSDAAIASGETSAKVLDKLHKRGVLLYSYGHLHSKVVVLDGTVFVSSANLSESSKNTLLEAGLETDNPTAVAQAIAFIEALAEQSEPVDAKFISRIEKIPVKKHWHPRASGKPTKRLKLSDEPKTWVIGLHSIAEPHDPAEVKRIEKGEEAAGELLSNPRSQTSWARLARSSRVSQFAKRSDSLIVILRSENKGSPEAVYHHFPVLLNQSEPTCNRIFYEEFPKSEKKALRWQEFKNLAKKVGLAAPSKNSVRELTPDQSSALHELWEEPRKK
jgi:hypothetical protein